MKTKKKPLSKSNLMESENFKCGKNVYKEVRTREFIMEMPKTSPGVQSSGRVKKIKSPDQSV